MSRTVAGPTPRSLGPLRVRMLTTGGAERDLAAPAPLTVVLLHGFGAPGDNLVSFAERIAAPPHTTFVLPEAPGLLDDLVLLNLVDDARVWWAKDARRRQREVHGEGVFPETRIFEAIEPACAAVLAMLDALEAEATSGPGTVDLRLVLGGFSQGAMLALDIALRTTRALAGVIFLSGAPLDDRMWTERMARRGGLPVFQAHGTDDAGPSFAGAEKLRDAMLAGGLSVTFSPFAAGHGIPPSVVHDLGPWLAQVEGGRRGA